MAVIAGIAFSTKDQKKSLILPTYSSTFHLKLFPDRHYKVALDQSSTCTGIAICDTMNDTYVMLDFQRDSNSKETFYTELFGFLYETFQNSDVDLLVYERPVPSHSYARAVLTELKGKLDEWIPRIPGFRNAYVDSLYPQSWKKFIVNTKKGGIIVGGKKKRRGDIKKLVASDICEILPLAEDYFNVCISKDYDSFDALGILLGFQMYAFDERGNMKIHGVEETSHASFVCFRKVTPDDMKQEGDILNGIFQEFAPFIGVRYLVYNSNYNLYKNVRMSSSNFDRVGTIVPKKEFAALDLEFDMNLEDGDEILMYVYRKGRLSKSEIRCLQSIFPWNKDIISDR